jgi:hypothetical protein
MPRSPRALGEAGDLHAGTVGVAVLALLPGDVGELGGWHAVIGVVHVPSSDFIEGLILANFRVGRTRPEGVIGLTLRTEYATFPAQMNVHLGLHEMNVH